MPEGIEIKSKKEKNFELFLKREDFYKDIRNFDEASNFKDFINEKYVSLDKKERGAELNYKSAPELKEYIDLKDRSYEIDQFIYNEAEFEPDSYEWKEKVQEIKDLENKAKKLLKENLDLKKLKEELSEKWNSAAKEKENFLVENKIPEKLVIIDNVLIPIFKQETKVSYLSNEREIQLEDIRDSLYERLEEESENKEQEIEEQITKVEKEIEKLPKEIERETKKLERMKNQLDKAIVQVQDNLYRLT